MKLSELLKEYYDRTARASDVARQLTFAGIAIVWIFKAQIDGQILLPQDLKLPLALLICSLGLDLFQYIIPSLMLQFIHRKKEEKNW